MSIGVLYQYHARYQTCLVLTIGSISSLHVSSSTRLSRGLGRLVQELETYKVALRTVTDRVDYTHG